MITDKEIDELLLANASKTWRKVARIVGFSMLQVDEKDRINIDDLYFAKRVEILINKGLLDYEGDLTKMGNCEVRLKVNIEHI